MSNLMNVQMKLKAPKNNRNSFGGYNYRSCEDILESVKPILIQYNCRLTLSDELVQIGDRYYIKATATFSDLDNGETVQVTAYAREAETKKGMDDSQITGTASSYARKYALNGLFLIDDTKDADTDEYQKQTRKKDIVRDPDDIISAQEASILKLQLEKTNSDVRKFCEAYHIGSVDELKVKDYPKACEQLNRKAEKIEVDNAG